VGERREIHGREGERAGGCRGKPTGVALRRGVGRDGEARAPSLSVQSSDW
jgi:hypothetical protein